MSAGKRPVKRCKKRRYRTSLDAKLALVSTFRSRSSRREECRVYRCPSCGGWHLTSLPLARYHDQEAPTPRSDRGDSARPPDQRPAA